VVHGVVVGLALLVIGLRVLRVVMPSDEAPAVIRTIKWALVLKLAAAPVYLYVVGRVYKDVGDYTLYHDQGALVAEQLRQGHFAVDVGPVIGLGATYYATGLVYLIVGTSTTAGALVFSWVAFWGLYLFYRAARLALPDLDRLRYARLLFLLPTALFWSSTIGKDALMVPSLGLSALGAARLLAARRGGFVLLAAGMAGSGLVRPHVGLMLFVAIIVAYSIRPSVRPTAAGPLLRVAGIAVLAGGGLILADQVARYLSVDRLDATSVEETLEDVSDETGSGSRFAAESDSGYESSFEPSGFRSPAEFPAAVVTVLFRPFPFEAKNMTSLLSALEGSFLLVAFAASHRRVTQAFRLWRRRPYVAVVLVYSSLFCYLFASIGNFGLLARQRVQLMPAVVVLLAMTALPVGRRATAGVVRQAR
jgi:hypothetical protein